MWTRQSAVGLLQTAVVWISHSLAELVHTPPLQPTTELSYVIHVTFSPEMDPGVSACTLPRLCGALVGEEAVLSWGGGSSLGGGEEGGLSDFGDGTLWNIGSRSIST